MKTFDLMLSNPLDTPLELAIEPWGMIYEIEAGNGLRVSFDFDAHSTLKPPHLVWRDRIVSLYIEGDESFRVFRGETELDPGAWIRSTPQPVPTLRRVA